jgi:murein DD-endopeptidase MepM/ murein hydrolase activator NlpD
MRFDRILDTCATKEWFVSSPFGRRGDPFGGSSSEFHSGIDIPTPTGSYPTGQTGALIIAPETGVVTDAGAGYCGGRGTFVEVETVSGAILRFMHLSASRVSVGEVVQRGDFLGYSGNTGRSTGAHLHFDVRKDGEFVNPIDYLAKLQ